MRVGHSVELVEEKNGGVVGQAHGCPMRSELLVWHMRHLKRTARKRSKSKAVVRELSEENKVKLLLGEQNNSAPSQFVREQSAVIRNG